MSVCVVFLILLIFASVSAKESESVEKIVNLHVTTNIDLKNQLTYARDIIEFLNEGNTILPKYLYSVPDPESIFIITFYNKNGKELSYKKLETSSKNSATFEVVLDRQLSSNQTYKLFCKIVYADKILPAVKQRTLEEDQLLKYEGNSHFFSPYKTKSFSVTFQLADQLISFSKTPDEHQDNQIKYFAENVKIHSLDPVVLVFINNNPFLVVRYLSRTISINHFGRISIEDIVTLENNGVKFVGPYFNKGRGSAKAATNWLYTYLPASAENIKYFDNIGNISQSAVHNYFSYLTFKFKTRYPLLGGWKTQYILQYDVPTHEYLFNLPKKNRYLLRIRAVDNVLNDKIIERAEVRIILPEGGTFETVNCSKSMNVSHKEISSLGGLSVFGRETLVLKGNYLFENYADNLYAEYYFDSLFLLKAPLLISSYFQILFIIYLCGRYLLD